MAIPLKSGELLWQFHLLGLTVLLLRHGLPTQRVQHVTEVPPERARRILTAPPIRGERQMPLPAQLADRARQVHRQVHVRHTVRRVRDTIRHQRPRFPVLRRVPTALPATKERRQTLYWVKRPIAMP